MKRIWKYLRAVLLVAAVCMMTQMVWASDLSIQEYAYGDPYIAVNYYGVGQKPQIFAYAGTQGLPGRNTKGYKASYNRSADEYRIKVPVQWKVGQKFTVRCVSWNSVYESYNIDVEKAKVRKPEDLSYYYWYITENATKVKVRVENVHKGDRIKIKIGGKTYTKKIPKAARKKTYTVKIKKAPAGTKMTVWVANKYNQALVEKDSTVIFKYKALQVGMSMSEVKLTLGWRTPSKINYYTYNEQWCYDNDDDGRIDSYLYFDNDGRLKNWQIFG